MSNKDTHENENSESNDEINDEAVDETTDESEDETDEEESEEEETNESEDDEEEDDSEEDDDESDDEEKSKDYRPKQNKSKEFVPLKKHLKLRKALQDLRKKNSEDSTLQTEDLDELADKYKLPKEFVKDFAKTMESRSSKKAQEQIAPILAKQQMNENERMFNSDFEKAILSKYPHLASKKEHFKKIAFSPDFVHLKSLEDIRKEFFAEIPAPKKKDRDSVEGGSSGSERSGDGDINLDNPSEEQLEKILDDPILSKKYYARQDAQGL